MGTAPAGDRSGIAGNRGALVSHSFGTNLASVGVTQDIRARLLNHVEGPRGVTDADYNQHEF